MSRCLSYLFWTPPDHELNSMLMLRDWQDSRCAMCGKIVSHLVFDHCHDTGLPRGWLCSGCNSNEGKDRSGNYGFHDPAWTTYRAFPPANLYGNVPPEEGKQRIAIPKQKLTHERRQEIARWICEARVDPRTPEQRSVDAKKASLANQAIISQWTAEERAEYYAGIGKKISATKLAITTPEQRAEIARYATAHLTHEQRSANSKKGDSKGEKNGRAKLTEFDVTVIKVLLELPYSQRPSNRAIAKLFNIGDTEISRIKLGAHWPNVKLELLTAENQILALATTNLAMKVLWDKSRWRML